MSSEDYSLWTDVRLRVATVERLLGEDEEYDPKNPGPLGEAARRALDALDTLADRHGQAAPTEGAGAPGEAPAPAPAVDRVLLEYRGELLAGNRRMEAELRALGKKNSVLKARSAVARTSRAGSSLVRSVLGTVPALVHGARVVAWIATLGALAVVVARGVAFNAYSSLPERAPSETKAVTSSEPPPPPPPAPVAPRSVRELTPAQLEQARTAIVDGLGTLRVDSVSYIDPSWVRVNMTLTPTAEFVAVSPSQSSLAIGSANLALVGNDAQTSRVENLDNKIAAWRSRGLGYEAVQQELTLTPAAAGTPRPLVMRFRMPAGGGGTVPRSESWGAVNLVVWTGTSCVSAAVYDGAGKFSVRDATHYSDGAPLSAGVAKTVWLTAPLAGWDAAPAGSNPADFDNQIDAAISAPNAADPDKALPYLQRALSLRPDSAMTLALIGKAHTLAKRYDEAVAALLKAAKLRPTNPEHRVDLGLAYYYAGNQELEIQCYRTALELNPDHERALLYLAETLILKGSLDEADALLRRLTAINPNAAKLADVRKELEDARAKRYGR